MQSVCNSFTVSTSVYKMIQSTIGSLPAETGGLLGIKDGVVCAYYFDKHGSSTSNEYRPNTDACEYVSNKLWYPSGIHICGFVHSHAFGTEPSRSDEQYTHALYDAIRISDTAVSSFYMVIANSVFHDAPFSLRPYQGLYITNKTFSLFPVDIIFSDDL